jgi:hypothetical protein
MIRRTLPLLALAALAACAAPPAPQPQTVAAAAPLPPEARLIAAIEANGCVYSRESSRDVLLAANMTQADAVRILLDLGAQGRAEPGGTEGAETVRILSDNCI